MTLQLEIGVMDYQSVDILCKLLMKLSQIVQPVMHGSSQYYHEQNDRRLQSPKHFHTQNKLEVLRSVFSFHLVFEIIIIKATKYFISRLVNANMLFPLSFLAVRFRYIKINP